MTTFRLSSGVQWVVDRFTVTVRAADGTSTRLHYPDAAIWDLVSRDYPFARVVALLAHIAALDRGAAESLVYARFEEWAAAGLLERREDTWPTSH
jgi:hypothetical protein